MNGTPDATESNAGDDFHLLWAARRALRLLDLNGPLKGIRVEGPSPKDAVVTEMNGDKLLGIDLSEYFEGTDFETAKRVVHSQLKYSTRRADQNWTAARLARGKKSGKPYDGSVIHRLAQAYKAHLDTHGRDVVQSKLAIRLVSNRPCATKLTRALSALQKFTKSNPQEVTLDDVNPVLSTGHQTELERLRQGAIGLKGEEFIDFLRVFDVSECGAPARLDQDIALVRELGELGFSVTAQQYESLKGLVHRRMMPESRRADVLTADHIVPALMVPSVQNLFPAEPRFEGLDRIIARSCIESIAKTIVEAGTNIVCLHGGAGTGKTTLIRCIGEQLPPGSVLIVFDCFGGGSYLNPAEIRHTHARALMQICNELAGKVGTGLLLPSDAPPEDLLREFVKRLRLAAQLIRAASPEALIVITVDAADNCVVAADRRGDVPFVLDLAQCEIPDGCRLVLTARSHRVDWLRLPEATVPIPVPNLELPESESHLHQFAPAASKDESQEH
jgi:hypothetical protein